MFRFCEENITIPGAVREDLKECFPFTPSTIDKSKSCFELLA